jgi:hypothetical protein
VRTGAALAFIAAVAALGIALARRPTVADGQVMAADLLDQLRPHGVTAMTCDPRIPIDRRGAVFRCAATLDDGEIQHIEYTMDRGGQLTSRLESSSGARHRRQIPAPADPWAN